MLAWDLMAQSSYAVDTGACHHGNRALVNSVLERSLNNYTDIAGTSGT